MKTVLVIENEHSLENCYYVNRFLKKWSGKVIDFSGFRMKEKSEIISAVMKCTDILCQTALANGSENQFDSMVNLLAQIKEPKTIHLKILCGGLAEYLGAHYSDEELLSIRHHNLFEIDENNSFDITETEVRFDERIDAHLKAQADFKKYLDEGKSRLTGRKVKIVACNANGRAFENLPIGQIVDEVDMSKTDSSSRGVWVWGNGEPVKLVNDCGLIEYELVGVAPFDIGIEIIKLLGLKPEEFSDTVKNGLAVLLSDEEYSAIDKANIICEDMNVPKRGNRERIRKFLEPTT